MSSKHALYFLTALTAAALLLFTLLANADDASAQQAVDNTLTPTSTPRAMKFRAISAGAINTCGIRTDGAAACWGNDEDGQSSPPSGVFSSISTNTTHACGLRADGAAACWGRNTSGQSAPPSGAFTSISAGHDKTCGLRADGAPVCWGSWGISSPPYDHLNLLAGGLSAIDAGYELTCGLRRQDSKPLCWGRSVVNGGFRDATTIIRGMPIPWDETLASISVGLHFACGLRADGTAVCWGWNHKGQSSPPSGSFTSISAGPGWHACGLRADGTAVCWGYDGWGQSSPPSGAFTSISAGYTHTCGLRKDGTAVCWGSDGYEGRGQTTPPIEYTPTATPNPAHTPTLTPTYTPMPTTVTQGVTPEPTHTPTTTSVSATDEPTLTPTSTSVTDEPAPTLTPTYTPTPTTVTEGVTPKPTHTPTTTSVSSTGESTPTPTSTSVTDEPAPTLTPTATGVSTPTGAERVGAFEEQAEALLDQAGTLQEVETDPLWRLVQTLRGLVNALTDILAARDGASPTATPTPTNTPVTVLEATPTPTATTIPTATPTRASASTLAPGCIRSISLGWLTGTWNADCLSDKTPPTAKTGTRYARFYTFTLDAPSSMIVNITSDDVADTYLYLLNGRGNAGSVVNRGDTQIDERLQPGTYTIEVTTYELKTGGNFMLTFGVAGLSRIR